MEKFVNLEENIGKTVGVRVAPRDGVAYAMGLQRLAVQVQRSTGHPRYPKGVFRFTSFEEADAWMTNSQIRKVQT